MYNFMKKYEFCFNFIAGLLRYESLEICDEFISIFLRYNHTNRSVKCVHVKVENTYFCLFPC